MWIMTKFGFFSVVEHKDNDQLFLVRARRKEHLQDLLDFLKGKGEKVEDLGIVDRPYSDYSFAILMNKTWFSACMVRVMQDINYHNFKDAVEDHKIENTDGMNR